MTPEGISYIDVLTNIPSPLYPMPDGVFPVWGALGGRTQAVFLGSDSRIYSVGTQDLLIDEVHSNGTAWGATNLELPENLTVCEVNKWEGTAGSGNGTGNATGMRDGFLAFSTFSGNLYITGDGASEIQDQASHNDWTKIDMPIGISVVDFAVGYRTLLVLGSDQNLYASGSNTYLGDGTISDLNTITLLTQPPISIHGITQIEAGVHSFLVLDGDRTIHVLGENSEASLGVGNINDVERWSKVGISCTGGILRNVAAISTLSSHDYRSSSSAILVDETIRSWGMNDNQSITSGMDRLITCSEQPLGNNSNATAVSNGGHITPFVNKAVQICNIGHNREGAFGDGNSDGEDYGTYTCVRIPGSPEVCGTKEADLELTKSVNESSPTVKDEITFTLTITNQGPNVSTGSTIRDQLTDTQFEYISDDSSGSFNNATGLWTIGRLNVGESVSINITVRVLRAGEHINYAEVLSDSEVDPDSTAGDMSTEEDDDDSVIVNVQPCPHSIVCQNLTSVPIGDCNSPIPSIYDAGNAEAEIDDIFDNITTCGIAGITHIDNAMPNSDFCSSIIRTYWLTDDDFELTSCTRVFTFDPDTEGPNLICPPDTMLTCGDDLPSTEVVLEGVDNCSPATIFNIINVSDENLADDFCLKPLTEIERTYTAIDDCNNESTCTQTLFFEPEGMYAPNIFSPNDDNSNNVWTVFNTPNIVIRECKIYDRWGNLVYSATDEHPEWDGEFNGDHSPEGIYVYTLLYVDAKGVDQMIKGDVTLIR